jgi:predicted DNA binding CopG/RHH family protein
MKERMAKRNFVEKGTNKLSRTTIYLPEELKRALKTKAAAEGITMVKIIVGLVEEYVKRKS